MELKGSITSRMYHMMILFVLVLCLAASPLALARAEAASQTENPSSETQRELKTGWVLLDNGSYGYRKADTLLTGFNKIGKKWFYFDASGNLATGWFTVRGFRYFAGTAGRVGSTLGKLKAGFCKAEGQYYMFCKTGGAGRYGRLLTGWVRSGSRLYYYTSDGDRLTGLQKVGGSIFFFQSGGSLKNQGRIRTGLRKINGSYYYFRKTGGNGVKGAALVSTVKTVGKKKYRFAADGRGTVINSKAAQTDSSTEKSTESSSNVKNTGFVETIGQLAHQDMLRSGVLASVTAAQAIIESNSGKSDLALHANNLFGMKLELSNSVWTGGSYRKQTLEYLDGKYIKIYADFRKYTSYAQSVADHSNYLTTAKNGSKLRYAGIAGCRDYQKTAQIIKNGGYATAPNYVSALCAVIVRYGLTQYD